MGNAAIYPLGAIYPRRVRREGGLVALRGTAMKL